MIGLATFTSVLTILFCTAVLVQAVRLDRRLKLIQSAENGKMVQALDEAARRAEAATEALRDLLRNEGARLQGDIGRGKDMADELTVMVGLADAAADRILSSMPREATGTAPANDAAEAEVAAVAAQ
ncbi:hypothetical protein B5C34_08820 [Pacificimonas flava]|uniref:DUF6468 domain-containing protein n=2 Tax=Pacificimonas TaxID=1960290 RepID=A0A219B5U0_9SPHN|nr:MULTISPECIES: DUF6468 domain-containing protein [Pacificimonas]MBZ6379232.1 hypothetical protein [Pacificimonas aurantium]OWV33554.1 hypothetical protein B5C34_08820 [Pacificimonas flava]